MALERGDHALAFDYAQRAAQAAPNDAQLWFLLGYAARLDGKYQESVDAYQHGLRISPAAADGRSGLAQVFSLTGRTAEAERLLQQVTASNPDRRSDVLLLGDLYMRSKDYAGAVSALSKAENMQPDARAELLLALCYQHMKQMDLASHYLDLAKQRAPNNLDVQRSLAGYYLDAGEYAEASSVLKAIRNPSPEITAELAYTYQLDGKFADSARIYAQAAHADTKDINMQLAAAQAEIAAGSTADADQFLKSAAAINANYYRLHAIRGEIASQQDRDQEAVREDTAALATLPADPAEGQLYEIQLRMDLVTLDRGLGDESGAHQQLAQAQSEIAAVSMPEANPGQYLRLRSLIRLNAGDFNGALSDIKQALTSDHGSRDDLQLDGDILMKLGRTDDAIDAYRQALSSDPDNRLALTALGYASRAAGRYSDAEKYFERLARVDSASYVPYLALGDLCTARREFTRAQTYYNQGYARAPKNALIVAGGMNAGIEAHNLPLAGQWFGRVTDSMKSEPKVLREEERYLSFEGKYQESAAAAQEAIKAMPDDRDVVVYLGYDLLHLGKDGELLALTSKYQSVLPKEPDIPLLAGYVHKSEGMKKEALEDFTEALKRDPTAVTAYVNCGFVLNDLGQPQAAAEDFTAAIKREPDDGEAHLGLAYTELDLKRPDEALRQAALAERTGGDERDLHIVRATAYGREGMLAQSAREYRAALQFAPQDAALHLGLGNTLFTERQFRSAIGELEVAEKLSPDDAETEALLARSYANLEDRDQALHYVELAERHIKPSSAAAGAADSEASEVLVSTGEALSVLGEQDAAMERFGRALTEPGNDRVGVRLAIAGIMEQQNHEQDAERQVALAWMEAEAGDTAPPSGGEYLAAADLFGSMHNYQLSQTYLQRAKQAGAPDAQVRIGLANDYLAQGDTVKAQAELAAIGDPADGANDYQYLLAKANLFRQEQQNASALTAFAQAADTADGDEAAEEGMMETGANEGLRLTPELSALSDFAVAPTFEDSTVYVLDSKLDATFAVPSSDMAQLPPPRSSIDMQWIDAFHLHAGRLPPASGFFQLRNARGLISVPSTNSIVNRDTTDSIFNVALNPSIHLGDNVVTFSSGIQGTIRRDSLDPVDMNQNLFREFAYMTTSAFFNAVSASGYIIRETGPFTESNLHSRDLAGELDFRVGAPWAKTALITGWGANDDVFQPAHIEDYYTSAYAGIERRFSSRLDVRALAEDLRAWRIYGERWGIAQELRPAANVDFTPTRNWEVQFSSAYANTRGFHVYDAIQNSFSVSYMRPIQRMFDTSSGQLPLKYPIRFSAGLEEESFFNFSGVQNQQVRPYFEVSIF
jgi:tetratricopeptide (TPR) repeat protein